MPIYQLRKVLDSDRHPKREDLKDNEGNVPGRAVGKGILAKAEDSAEQKGEEQELVTVERMWAAGTHLGATE